MTTRGLLMALTKSLVLSISSCRFDAPDRGPCRQRIITQPRAATSKLQVPIFRDRRRRHLNLGLEAFRQSRQDGSAATLSNII